MDPETLNQLQQRIDDQTVSIQMTRRQARMLYSIVSGMLNELQSVQDKLEYTHLSLQNQVRQSDLSGIHESLYMDGWLGAYEPGDLAQMAFGSLLSEQGPPTEA